MGQDIILGKPHGLETVVTAVFDDEPCFSLKEENRLSDDSKSMNRYQILRLVRQDRLVTACIFLGLASRFTADQFQLVGGFVDDEGKGEALHTVAELRETADEIRSRPPLRDTAPRDLQMDYIAHVEETIKRQKHVSTFGSGVQLVRA